TSAARAGAVPTSSAHPSAVSIPAGAVEVRAALNPFILASRYCCADACCDKCDDVCGAMTTMMQRVSGLVHHLVAQHADLRHRDFDHVAGFQPFRRGVMA